MDPTRDEPGHLPQGDAQEASGTESAHLEGAAHIESAAHLEEASHLEGASELEGGIPLESYPEEGAEFAATPSEVEPAPLSTAHIPDSARPSFLFFGVVAAISLI